jgi:hypothetical protein
MKARSRPLAGRVLATAVSALLLALLSPLSQPSMAAFPGLNGDIAYVVLNESIFTMNPDGNNEARLIPGESDSTPAWSPDGNRVVYRHDSGESGGLRIFDTRTGDSVALTDDYFDTNPSWSPDGNRIAFDRSIGDGGMAIFVVDDKGAGAARLTSFNETDPSWSPDGRLIAFADEAGSESRIAVIQPDGRARRELTSGFVDINPTWSPDGRSIAFARAPKPPPTSPPPSPSPPPPIPAPAPPKPASPLSPGLDDIDSELFCAFCVFPSLAPPTFHGPAAHHGTHPHLTMTIAQSAAPRDGRMTLATIPTPTPQFDIYRMNADGSSVTRLTTSPATDVYPTWSPDGTMIAFQRATGSVAPGLYGSGDSITSEIPAPSSTSDIYRMNADGTSVTPLTSTGEESEPDWQAIQTVRVTFAPDLEFGNVDSGTTSPAKIATLTNTGTLPVRIRSVTITGAHRSDFAIRTDTCAERAIPPASNCTVSVTFKPTAPGLREATLTVVDNAVGSPHTVLLRGGQTVTETTPVLAVTPSIGPPGFVTYAHGTGFPPGAVASLAWEPGIGGARVTAGPSGSFTVPVLVFYKDALGPRRLVATSVSGPPFSPVEAAFLARPGTGQPRRLLGRR